MRDPSEWTEADLAELIRDDVQESLHLDYKRSDALARNDKCRDEISKDVAAFANSDGGRIIYGIVEKGHHPERIDDGVDAAEFNREWLEQIVSSNIQPKIDGLRIHPIGLASKGPGRVSYVMDIPQSKSRAPHQSRDHKYYKRYNFQSVPMADYEIRDIMRRASTPDLWIKFAFMGGQTRTTLDFRGGSFAAALHLNPEIGNRSSTPAEYAVIILYVDAFLHPVHSPPSLRHIGNTKLNGQEFLVYQMHWTPPRLPIFAETMLPIAEGGIAFTVQPELRGVGELWFGYKIQSPGFADEKFVRAIMQAWDLWIPEQ
jgi:hypothetical protein